jgi:hypothetical protein
MDPVFCCPPLTTAPRYTRWFGADGLFIRPNILAPFNPSQTGSPSTAPVVSIPSSKPNVIIWPLELFVIADVVRPRVFDDPDSVRFVALEINNLPDAPSEPTT